MADITIKKKTGISTTETLHPTTTWSQVENKPTTFTPTAHTHTKSDITDFAHTHVSADITDLKENLKYLYIYGKAQSAITKGQAVQFAGVQGDHILLKPAVPSEINTNPDYFVGLAETTLATDDFGYVLTHGELSGINTFSYTEGAILWFASAGSTAGALTQTEPTGLNARIQVAAVNRTNVGNGIIFVRVHNVGVQVQDIVASGTRSASTFLNGEGAWATVTGGGGDFLPLTGGNITGNLNVSGNVGIGTTNPSNKLTVSEGIIRSERNTAGPAFQASVNHSGSSNTSSIGYQSSVQSSGTSAVGVETYGFSASDDVYGINSFAEAFSGNTYGVQAAATTGGTGRAYAFYGPYGLNYFAGNVGIGIENPGAKLDVAGNIRLTGTPTPTNQARTIEFTGFDKEGTTDFSDNAYIRHTVNSGGLTGSVLEISSQNDAQDGINFITPTVDSFRHNGNIIVTGANIGAQSVNFASSAGAVAWGNVSSKPANIMYYQGFTLDANTMDTNATGFTYANNAPAVGPVARFSTGGGYDLWLNAPYSGGNNLYFRTRNGDNATLNPWKTIWHDGNLSPVTTTNNTSLNDDSRNTRGVTRVYRRDDNSDFSIQHNWTGAHWHIRGYNGDTFHAEARVGYADSTGYLDGTWNTTGRNYNREWIEMPNHTGLYSAINNAHFYPNDGSYGAWRVIGSRNGWGGLEFVTSSNGNVSIMVASNATEVGFHNNNVGWQMYWSSGTGYIGKNSIGGGTLAVILDSVNRGSYAAAVNSTSTVSGGVKTRLSGNTLYITNNGNNP
jgi:hypothetical protein